MLTNYTWGEEPAALRPHGTILWYVHDFTSYLQLIQIASYPLEDQPELRIIKFDPDYGMLSIKKQRQNSH